MKTATLSSAARSSSRQEFESMADGILYRRFRRDFAERVGGFLCAVTKCNQCMQRVAPDFGIAAGDCSHGAELVAQFQQQPLRRLLADTGNPDEPRTILGRDRLGQ